MNAVRLAESDADIIAAFPVMAELRPHLSGPEEFLARARRQMALADWRLIYMETEGGPAACASFRILENLAWGKTLYVDDLITRESHRGQGHGETLMRWLEATARREGCAQLHLDSGTHRLAAHRFYHRLKLAITSFHFGKTL